MWFLPRYTSGNLAFGDLSPGLSASGVVRAGVRSSRTALTIRWKLFLEYFGTKKGTMETFGGTEGPRKSEVSRTEIDFLGSRRGAERSFIFLELSWLVEQLKKATEAIFLQGRPQQSTEVIERRQERDGAEFQK